MSDTTAGLIWAEEQRLMERQEADLEALKGRATVLISMGAVVAGLFGGLHATHARSPWETGWTVAALIAFAAMALNLVLGVLSPQDWKFALSMRPYIQRMEEGQTPPVDTFIYNVSRGFESGRKANQTILNTLQDRFRASCMLIAAQVVFWGLASI